MDEQTKVLMQNQALMKMLLQNQVASNQVLLEATGGTPGPTSAGGAASTGNGRGGSEGGSGGRVWYLFPISRVPFSCVSDKGEGPQWKGL